MKNGRYELSDLDAKEIISALLALLIDKNILTKKEFEFYRDSMLEIKNHQLEKELSENPSSKFMFDMFFKRKE